jgi:hypothetical protein
MLTDFQRTAYIAHALDLLAEVLAPKLQQTLNNSPLDWSTAISTVFRNHPQARSGTLDPKFPPWDPYYLIQALLNKTLYGGLFSKVISAGARSHIFELRDIRNSLSAHKQTGTLIPHEDVYRAIDDVVRIFSEVSAPQTVEAMDIRTKVALAFSDSRPLLSIERISRSQDIEFSEFVDLLHRSFPDNRYKDLDLNLERWLEEADYHRKKRDSCEDIMLVAKDDRYKKVVALLYATYYYSSNYVFINFLSIDQSLVAQFANRGEFDLEREITHRSIPSLLLELTQYTPDRKGILLEMDINGENELRQRLKRYAKSFLKATFYEIPIPYHQPMLDPTTRVGTIEQSLMFIPSESYQESITAEDDKLHQTDMVEILRFVYLQLYQGAYERTKHAIAYSHHLEELFGRVSGALKEDWIQLKPVRA